jgi:hypothetical protein
VRRGREEEVVWFNFCGSRPPPLKRTPPTPLLEAASTASHAVTNAVHDAKNPLGNVTYAAFKAVDAALYAKNLSATCNPADRKPPPKAFGFDGSGQLLPFYTGVVTGLQARGVLTPEVARSAKFGGLSGGSIVSVLAAAGWSGADMFAAYKQVVSAVQQCAFAVISGGGTLADAQLQCTLTGVGLPILRAALEARNPDLTSVINDRVDIWACQVNALGTTLANSVAQGTNKVRGREREGCGGGLSTPQGERSCF